MCFSAENLNQESSFVHMWDKAKVCISWQGKWAVICLWFENKIEEDPEFLDDVSLNDILWTV